MKLLNKIYFFNFISAFFYFRSNCEKNIGTILRRHYNRPYFLPENAESEKTDWIFMGSPGYGAPMHVSIAKLL